MSNFGDRLAIMHGVLSVNIMIWKIPIHWIASTATCACEETLIHVRLAYCRYDKAFLAIREHIISTI